MWLWEPAGQRLLRALVAEAAAVAARALLLDPVLLPGPLCSASSRLLWPTAITRTLLHQIITCTNDFISKCREAQSELD